VETETGHILSSEAFDRSFDDVFEIQDLIAEGAVAAMAVEIERAERERLHARNPDSLDAYSLCLRGTEEILQVTPTSCERAMVLFQKAARDSPTYARAYASISRAYGFQWKYSWVSDRYGALEDAASAAKRAIDADANDARAHAELGWVSLYRREHDRSLAAYSRARQLNPSDADIIAEYADVLKHNGQPDQAVALFERAIRLNPHQADHYRKDLAHTHLVNRDFEAAIETVSQMVRPEISRRVLAASYALSGRQADAEREAAALKAEYPEFSPDIWIKMVPDRLPEYGELFLEGLKKAGL
jgi:tetratricopeptide (TPR) repeat protein